MGHILKRDSHRVMIRMVLTVTRVYETLYVKPQWDLAAILTPYSGLLQLKQAINIYSDFVESLSLKRFGQYSIKPSSKFIIRSKRGPNGPSIASAHLDSLAVYQNKRLFNALKS